MPMHDLIATPGYPRFGHDANDLDIKEIVTDVFANIDDDFNLTRMPGGFRHRNESMMKPVNSKTPLV